MAQINVPQFNKALANTPVAKALEAGKATNAGLQGAEAALEKLFASQPLSAAEKQVLEKLAGALDGVAAFLTLAGANEAAAANALKTASEGLPPAVLEQALKLLKNRFPVFGSLDAKTLSQLAGMLKDGLAEGKAAFTNAGLEGLRNLAKALGSGVGAALLDAQVEAVVAQAAQAVDMQAKIEAGLKALPYLKKLVSAGGNGAAAPVDGKPDPSGAVKLEKIGESIPTGAPVAGKGEVDFGTKGFAIAEVLVGPGLLQPLAPELLPVDVSQLTTLPGLMAVQVALAAENKDPNKVLEGVDLKALKEVLSQIADGKLLTMPKSEAAALLAALKKAADKADGQEILGMDLDLAASLLSKHVGGAKASPKEQEAAQHLKGTLVGLALKVLGGTDLAKLAQVLAALKSANGQALDPKLVAEVRDMLLKHAKTGEGVAGWKVLGVDVGELMGSLNAAKDKVWDGIDKQLVGQAYAVVNAKFLEKNQPVFGWMAKRGQVAIKPIPTFPKSCCEDICTTGKLGHENMQAIKDKFSMRYPRDIGAFVQWVIRESYQDQMKDLEFFAEKVERFNARKKEIREQIALENKALSAAISKKDNMIDAKDPSQGYTLDPPVALPSLQVGQDGSGHWVGKSGDTASGGVPAESQAELAGVGQPAVAQEPSAPADVAQDQPTPPPAAQPTPQGAAAHVLTPPVAPPLTQVEQFALGKFLEADVMTSGDWVKTEYNHSSFSTAPTETTMTTPSPSGGETLAVALQVAKNPKIVAQLDAEGLEKLFIILGAAALKGNTDAKAAMQSALKAASPGELKELADKPAFDLSGFVVQGQYAQFTKYPKFNGSSDPRPSLPMPVRLDTYNAAQNWVCSFADFLEGLLPHQEKPNLDDKGKQVGGHYKVPDTTLTDAMKGQLKKAQGAPEGAIWDGTKYLTATAASAQTPREYPVETFSPAVDKSASHAAQPAAAAQGATKSAQGGGASSGSSVDAGGSSDNGGVQYAATSKELEAHIKELEEQLNSVGEDAQLANVDMQNNLQRVQQSLQMISNISKTLHDTSMAIIRNMGG